MMRTVSIRPDEAERKRMICLPADIVLERGSHSSYGEGVCAMELVDYLARRRRGETVRERDKLTDRPVSVCPVIAALVRSWNDGIRDAEERTRILTPLLPFLIDTRSTPAVQRRRVWAAVDWLVREAAPAWLALAGLGDHAQRLRGLRVIDCSERAADAAGVLVAARDAARAAADAATDAARAAADADAATDVALDAGDAVWDALAAAKAVWAAWADADADADAVDVADAAKAAAADAAWVVAMAAATDAARAAGDALRPTVEQLQASAQDLVRRMCAATRRPMARNRH